MANLVSFDDSAMNQHYVPAGYLKAFVDPDSPHRYEPYVWVSDFASHTARARGVHKVASKTNYNAWPAEGGGTDDAAEKLFGEFESAALPVIRSLIERPRRLDDEPFGSLNAYLALQFVRVPAIRDRLMEFHLSVIRKLNDMLVFNRATFERAVRESQPDRQFSQEEMDSCYAFASNPDNYTLTIDEWASLQDALRLAGNVEPVLGHMNWSCFEAPEGEKFVTSDRPVVVINPLAARSAFGHGLLAEDIEVTFPLGPRLCYFGSWSEQDPVRRVDTKAVAEINARTIYSAHRQTYSSTKALAEFALQTRPAK